ncbi:MAG TPA: RNA pyrophosphohydrolase [Hyphomicrobiaceae bacterium]|nr:RNA pyrophosphohydrolase [Hyphomicrobiaceae bacterium]
MARERTETDEERRSSLLPLRTGVGILLLDHRGRVFIGRRIPRWSPEERYWHMPQGGVEAGENLKHAARRELAEETSIKDCEIVGKTDGWLRYDLPEELLGIALKGRYRGQRLRWYAMRFLGRDRDINLNPRGRPRAEFEDWRWEKPEAIAALTIPYKRRLYEEVIEYFAAEIARHAPRKR